MKPYGNGPRLPKAPDAIIARRRPQAAIEGPSLSVHCRDLRASAATAGSSMRSKRQGRRRMELAAVMRGSCYPPITASCAGVFSTCCDTPQVYLTSTATRRGVGSRSSDVSMRCNRRFVAPSQMIQHVRPNLAGQRQAEAKNRDAIEDLYRVYVQGRAARWCDPRPGAGPAGSGPQAGASVTTACARRSFNGAPTPGFSFRKGVDCDGRTIGGKLPAGSGFE